MYLEQKKIIVNLKQWLSEQKTQFLTKQAEMQVQESEEILAKGDLVIATLEESYEKNFQRACEIRDSATLDHLNILCRKRNQLVITDDYGVEDDSKWMKELEYFFKQVVYPQIIHDTVMDLSHITYEAVYTDLLDEEYLEGLKIKCNSTKNLEKIEYDENMTPIEYEYFCANILNNLGWDTQVTKASGDQGADVIAKKNGKTIVIQCKKYSSPVGNKSVQEVFTAKEHFYADEAFVVTNHTYTMSAKELAKSTKVKLLHHDDLLNLA